jgi:hypothetical protein
LNRCLQVSCLISQCAESIQASGERIGGGDSDSGDDSGGASDGDGNERGGRRRRAAGNAAGRIGIDTFTVLGAATITAATTCLLSIVDKVQHSEVQLRLFTRSHAF